MDIYGIGVSSRVTELAECIMGDAGVNVQHNELAVVVIVCSRSYAAYEGAGGTLAEPPVRMPVVGRIAEDQHGVRLRGRVPAVLWTQSAVRLIDVLFSGHAFLVYAVTLGQIAACYDYPPLDGPSATSAGSSWSA